MPTHEFSVAMTCSGCSGAVEKVLSKLGDKIQNYNVDLNSKTVQVTSNLTSDELLAVLKKTGKETRYIGIKK